MEKKKNTPFTFEDSVQRTAKIRVIGVGGGGGNALNNMIQQGVHGVEFVAVNTDVQALANNLAGVKIQVGKELTKGLGAGARAKIGMEAVEESRDEIEAVLKECDMVFITAGMGGGTGTGAAPTIAAYARQMGILTVGIVTRPFMCEGPKRMRAAESGIEALRDNVDTLIVISNERLLDMDSDASLQEAFLTADEVLYNATRGISELITVHGLINLDFADVRTTMKDGGTAMMAAATCSGDHRARRAAEQALTSPLLEGMSIAGARNVLVNVTAGPSLKIGEATMATKIIQEAAGDDAEVIFGTVIDETMGDNIRVTVIATGFHQRPPVQEEVPHIELEPQRPRRTSVLLDNNNGHGISYKGQDNLRALDTPAYVRRSAPWAEDDLVPVEATPRNGHSVRRMQADEFQKRRSGKDSKGAPEPPAFIKKMLD